MDSPGIEAVLAAAEDRVARGAGLGGSGFHRVVRQVKKNRELAERYGSRISRIDDAAFRNWAALVVPLGPGTVLAVLALCLGLVAIGWSYRLDGPAAVLVFYGGFVAMLGSTHGLAHLITGRLLGIRFTSWFVGSWTRPQPGVKVEYESYLRASAPRRAWMHASGAIVTKLLPLSLVGAALAAGLPNFAVWGLLAFFVLAVAIDVFWSTKSSDWARFSREMRLA